MAGIRVSRPLPGANRPTFTPRYPVRRTTTLDLGTRSRDRWSTTRWTFDSGSRKEQAVFGPGDVAYVRETLPRLVDLYRSKKNPDLVTELISSMTYLGGGPTPPAGGGSTSSSIPRISPGRGGDYERHRPTYGRYLEQQAYRGDWPNGPGGAPPQKEGGRG